MQDDDRVEIELELEPELIETIRQMAANSGKTFDQMVESIIQAAMDAEVSREKNLP